MLVAGSGVQLPETLKLPMALLTALHWVMGRGAPYLPVSLGQTGIFSPSVLFVVYFALLLH